MESQRSPSFPLSMESYNEQEMRVDIPPRASTGTTYFHSDSDAFDSPNSPDCSTDPSTLASVSNGNHFNSNGDDNEHNIEESEALANSSWDPTLEELGVNSEVDETSLNLLQPVILAGYGEYRDSPFVVLGIFGHLDNDTSTGAQFMKDPDQQGTFWNQLLRNPDLQFGDCTANCFGPFFAIFAIETNQRLMNQFFENYYDTFIATLMEFTGAQRLRNDKVEEKEPNGDESPLSPTVTQSIQPMVSASSSSEGRTQGTNAKTQNGKAVDPNDRFKKSLLRLGKCQSKLQCHWLGNSIMDMLFQQFYADVWQEITMPADLTSQLLNDQLIPELQLRMLYSFMHNKLFELCWEHLSGFKCKQVFAMIREVKLNTILLPGAGLAEEKIVSLCSYVGNVMCRRKTGSEFNRNFSRAFFFANTHALSTDANASNHFLVVQDICLRTRRENKEQNKRPENRSSTTPDVDMRVASNSSPNSNYANLMRMQLYCINMFFSKPSILLRPYEDVRHQLPELISALLASELLNQLFDVCMSGMTKPFAPEKKPPSKPISLSTGTEPTAESATPSAETNNNTNNNTNSNTNNTTDTNSTLHTTKITNPLISNSAWVVLKNQFKSALVTIVVRMSGRSAIKLFAESLELGQGANIRKQLASITSKPSLASAPT